MDKALLIVFALLISALLGSGWYWARWLLDFLHASHLFNTPAKLIRDMERKLNRENRLDEELKFRGILLTIIVLALSLFSGWLFSVIFSNPFFTLVLLALCLPVGSSWSRVNTLKKNLQIGNLPAARQQLEGTVFRHHAILDSPALARAGIEYLIVQLFNKIITPIFWFMLFGVAGLLASLALCLLQETLSGAVSKSTAFGKGASDAMWLLNYLPVRLATFLWVLAMLFLPSINLQSATTKISSRILTASPHELALTCAASGLNLVLGGKTSAYFNDNWVGTGRITPTIADITRTQFLFIITCLLLTAGIGIFI